MRHNVNVRLMLDYLEAIYYFFNLMQIIVKAVSIMAVVVIVDAAVLDSCF